MFILEEEIGGEGEGRGVLKWLVQRSSFPAEMTQK